MRDLLEEVVDAASRRADYADARFVHTRCETLSTRNGKLSQLDETEEEGIGVRVRVGGSWGFAATRGTTTADVGGALERALSVAAAQPAGEGAAGGPEQPGRGE